eukprot:TRINITY_DN276_c0_g2_i3.p1 TRINITY_DN276_c0_g2~~TRINITY_DN276_c0_g2_i3.p1  ORF type:complete len:107 (-),score=40.05 TRINITY_DN276_c0_g2_i3:241-561(-)
MALVMRIKFPPTYPLIYKTLRIESNLTCQQAVFFISDSLNVPVIGRIGLYLPQDKQWLDDDTALSSYPQLQDAEEVEFRFRDRADGKPAGGGGGSTRNDDKCCLIL